MNTFNKHKWIFLFLAFIISILSAWKPQISFSILSDEEIAVKVYYNNRNEDIFDILHSNPAFILEENNKQHISVSVGNYKQLNSIRLDFSETGSNIFISNLKIDYLPLLQYTLSTQEIIDNISYSNIEKVTSTEQNVIFSECNINASICLSNINDIISLKHFTINWGFLVRFIRNLLLILICYYGINKLKKIHIKNQSKLLQIGYWIVFSICFSCFLELIFLPTLIQLITHFPLYNLNNYFLTSYNFSLNRCYFFFIVSLVISCLKFMGADFVYKHRYNFIILLFILLVAGKFSYSSITSYDLMLLSNTENYENPAILGRSQGIRADEWAIEKPYYFAQAAKGVNFPYFNNNLMISGADMIVMAAAPVKDIMILTHPALLGFLFLPIEYAFSFYWNFRIIFLFLGGFELGTILLKRKSYALALALSLLFSPPIQWWFSQGLVDMIIWGQLSIVMWYKLINSPQKHIRSVFASLLAMTINCYIYVMYPATQVPFAYFYLVLVIIISCLHKELKPFRLSMWAYYFISIFIIGGFACYFIYKSGPALEIMMNTVYPGNNRSWGIYSWDYELLPFMNLFTATYKDSTYLNNCETAQFIYFLPNILLLSLYLLKKYRKNVKVKFFLFLAGLVIFFEVMTKMPDRTFISDILFLGMTYPRRLYLIVGYGFFWIMWILIDICTDEKIKVRNIKNWNLCLFILLIFSVLYSPVLREYFEIGQSYIGTPIVFLLVGLCIYISSWLFDYNKHKKFIISYVIICIFSTVFINPIIINMDSIYEKNSVRAVQKIAINNPEGRWITSGNAGIGNMISSIGIKRCSGYYYYPDLEMMKIIDPELKYENVWNSFSAIDMRLCSGDNSIDSEGISLTVWINMETAKQLGIKYIYSINYDYSELEEAGILKNLYNDLLDDVRIYEINYNH